MQLLLHLLQVFPPLLQRTPYLRPLLKNQLRQRTQNCTKLLPSYKISFISTPAADPEPNVVRGAQGTKLLYLDHHSLAAGSAAALYAASQVSPAALMAAWTAFTATFSGPIAVATAVLGATFFADLAVKIVGAVAEGKGIAFYSSWGVPPLKSEIE